MPWGSFWTVSDPQERKDKQLCRPTLPFASTENKQCKRGIIVKKKVRVMMTMKMLMTIKMTMTTVLTLGGSRQGTSSQYQYCYLDLVI